MLLIERRAPGIAARAMPGYLNNPSIALVDECRGTHAWADIYVTGAGWVAYDPTNGTIGGTNLIRVAATRDVARQFL